MNFSAYEMAILEAARSLGAEALTSDPRQLSHVRGVLAASADWDQHAIAELRRTLNHDRTNRQCYLALGDRLDRKNPLAAAAYLCALRLAPAAVTPYVKLAECLLEMARPMEAVAMIREALLHQPDDPRLYVRLGGALAAQGRLSEAILQHERALRLNPHEVDGHWQLGYTRLMRGDWDLATASLRETLRLEGRATALASDRQWDVDGSPMTEALEVFRRSLTPERTTMPALKLLASLFEQLGRRREVELAWLAFADVAFNRRRFGRALHAYRKVLWRNPDSIGARLGVARTHMAVARPRKAIPHLKMALTQRREYDPAWAGLGEALQLTGDIPGSWEAFSRYYFPKGANAREFEQPVWDGCRLDGKTILLWSRFGRGDIIQFLRFVNVAHGLGGRVIIECHHQSLLPLIREMENVHLVVRRGAPLPRFDVHAPLMCLPAVVPTCRQTIPDHVPYLSVEPHHAARSRESLSLLTGKKVGISWGGAAAHVNADIRFTSLQSFAPLAAISGIRLVNLQHGAQASELLSPPKRMRVEVLHSETFSIMEAAALVAELDLVITIDSMIAHLAGALGTPVWTLLSHPPNWRWGSSGDLTPWYPSMRLFRQTTSGDWTGVVERVARALEARDWSSSSPSPISASTSPKGL